MPSSAAAKRSKLRLSDELRFLSSWLRHPLKMGAIAPSGAALTRAMAAEVDPSRSGPVIELGPGTGVATKALLGIGIAPERLVLVEYSREFCDLLRERYPAATVVQGDAYRLRQTLAGIVHEPAAAIVSGLPLLTRPLLVRVRLLESAFRLLGPGAPFVQFSYGLAAPIPARPGRYSVTGSRRIWQNVPPARVWVYRRERK
jgi:phosphatidylethanolamine/phosphatidyl-N-methylethanolamine N-methyltransferase